MKYISLRLSFSLLLIGHNLAQNTNYEGKKHDFSAEILHELKSTSMRLQSMEQMMLTLLEPCSCLDLLRKGITKNGVYTIYIPTNWDSNKAVKVYCDMETDGGGWMVFQRRTDGSEDFYRRWNDYKEGFGSLTNEFWLGNDNLYQILTTCGKHHELRIDLGDFDNATRYATYSAFKIAGETDNYRLGIGGYSGNAGDAMAIQNGQQFSTIDRDNDPHSVEHCAELYKGAWWHQKCHRSNLNGLYLKGPSVYGEGINWVNWRGYTYSLKFTEMKIRPNTCG